MAREKKRKAKSGKGTAKRPCDFDFHFRFGFRGVCEVAGTPGENVEFTQYCLLFTNCAERIPLGASSWEQLITSTGCEIISVSTEHTVLAPGEKEGLFGRMSFRFNHLDPNTNGGKSGIYSELYIKPDSPFERTRGLPPGNSPHTVLKLKVRATIPVSGVCGTCALRYELRLESTAPPFLFFTGVGAYGGHYPPELGETQIRLCPAGGLQLPGDGNQDGALDLSDAIWLLGHLFLGTIPALPCEGGTAANPGPGELRLLDSNGDQLTDISDAVRVLGFLFGGTTPPPVLGTECVRILGCPEGCRN